MKLMTHIVGGYPSMEECEEIALTMADAGVAYIEIQIPFSDPVADGETIMKACQDALDNGVTTDDCFELMKRLKGKIDTPLLFMTYYNVVYKYGVERFCEMAKEAGCYGLIVPDVPYDEEEHEHFLEICEKHGLKAIQVVSPITPERRLKKITEVASGFVYCVSRFGTTGEKQDLDEKISQYLKRVKEHIKTPLALGFGISTKEQVKLAAKEADIVVIGSKVINLYKEEGLKSVRKFLDTVTD